MGEAAVTTLKRHPDVASQRIVAIDGKLHMSVDIKNKEKVTTMKQLVNFRGLINKTVNGLKCTITAVACVSCWSSAPLTKI